MKTVDLFICGKFWRTAEVADSLRGLGVPILKENGLAIMQYNALVDLAFAIHNEEPPLGREGAFVKLKFSPRPGVHEVSARPSWDCNDLRALPLLKRGA